MKKRFYKGFLIFDIDNNGDNYNSFEKAVAIIRGQPVFHEEKYYSGFFDDGLLWGNCEGIDIKLEYSGFMGTELKVFENLSELELSKVHKWVEEIYNVINNNAPI